MFNALDLTLLYLIAAVLGVVLCRYLKLPPILGYLVVGVLIGPHALALAGDSASIGYLAEFGVVFLMFAIGLEFNLPKLRSLRLIVFGLGTLQVLITIAGTIVGALIMTVIEAGCSHMSLDNWVQEICTGVIIIIAVALDRYRQRRAG